MLSLWSRICSCCAYMFAVLVLFSLSLAMLLPMLARACVCALCALCISLFVAYPDTKKNQMHIRFNSFGLLLGFFFVRTFSFLTRPPYAFQIWLFQFIHRLFYFSTLQFFCPFDSLSFFRYIFVHFVIWLGHSAGRCGDD